MKKINSYGYIKLVFDKYKKVSASQVWNVLLKFIFS